MVPLAQTDVIVAVRIFMTSTEPHRTRDWVEGESYDEQIANTKQDLREALEAERWADMPELQARLAELRKKHENATRSVIQNPHIVAHLGRRWTS